MGLDVVELVLAVEDTFGIELRDEEAQEVITVGDLHDLVMRKLEGVTSLESEPPCHSSHVFYRVRRALRDCAHIPRRETTPQSDVERLFAATHADEPKRRREVWAQFGDAVGLSVPPLQLPGGTTVDAAIAIGTIGALMLATWALGSHLGIAAWSALFVLWLSVGLALSVCAAILVYRFTRRFADRIPPQCETVGGLVRKVATINSAQLIHELGTTPEAIWERLQEIVAAESGMPIERVTREANFYKDLRLG
ncbi:MAG TPA: hypothetical protein DGT21_18085 [Armatimonadetes bacterium]|jgi:hypothetical protein|nr:hypothetical protein [Armatimonadota bacterium]